jgi:biotin synthase
MENSIQALREKVLVGNDISMVEALDLISLNRKNDILALVALACEVRERHKGDKVDFCSLINAKSGQCPEDCKFCAQSSRYNSSAPSYTLLEPSTILQAAREAEQNGAGHFCLVTSGKRISEAEFASILETLQEIKKTTGLRLDCSLGHLPKEYFIELHRIGVSRYNHNLEAAKSFFPAICSTHTYQDRWDTVRAIQEAGLETCCGGIIGMGETWEPRLELAFALKELGVECATINILNPRPGTPLAHIAPLPPWEIIKTIAIFRLILPNGIIKLAGGRERNLRDLQSLGILAGANGLIIGGYLTTSGRSIAEDVQMIKDLDLET